MQCGCSSSVSSRGATGRKQTDLHPCDGSQIEAPIARVSIDTPYFVGEVDAWCLKNPLFEIIIRNIPKARDQSDQDRNWKPSQANAVMTRQQAKREGKKDKPLHVPDIIGPELAFSPDDVIRAQEEDELLYRIRQPAEQPPDESRKVRFFRKKGILYRSFQSPTVEHNKKFSQLIVPKPLRNKKNVSCTRFINDRTFRLK